MPDPHGMQGPDPLMVLKVPAAHGKQTPPSAPEYPALQMQACEVWLPFPDQELAGHPKQAVPPLTSRYDPGRQSEHASDPFTALYFPFGHAVQVEASLEYPALQIHPSSASFPVLDEELTGHAVHTLAPLKFV